MLLSLTQTRKDELQVPFFRRSKCFWNKVHPWKRWWQSCCLLWKRCKSSWSLKRISRAFPLQSRRFGEEKLGCGMCCCFKKTPARFESRVAFRLLLPLLPLLQLLLLPLLLRLQLVLNLFLPSIKRRKRRRRRTAPWSRRKTCWKDSSLEERKRTRICQANQTRKSKNQLFLLIDASWRWLRKMARTVIVKAAMFCCKSCKWKARPTNPSPCHSSLLA
jgi:hypothetical protein